MQPQRLDVAGDQPHRLARRQHLRQRRQMIAGEDIFVGERVGRARPCPYLPMVWSSITPSSVSSSRHLREEFLIMRRADMLEHADRDDPVEPALRRRDSRSARTGHDRRRRPPPPAGARPSAALRDRVMPSHVDARRPCADRAPSRPSRSRCRARAGPASGAAWRRYALSCRPAPARGCWPGSVK